MGRVRLSVHMCTDTWAVSTVWLLLESLLCTVLGLCREVSADFLKPLDACGPVAAEEHGVPERRAGRSLWGRHQAQEGKGAGFPGCFDRLCKLSDECNEKAGRMSFI